MAAMTPSLSSPPPSLPPSPTDSPPSTEEADSLERSNRRIKDGERPASIASDDGTKSFKQSLMDGLRRPRRSLVTREELLAADVVDMIEDNQDQTAPISTRKMSQMRISEEIHDRLCVVLKNAVIIKLLGKTLSFFTLHARLLRDWKTEQEFEVIDIGQGYYMVKFASQSDCMSILMGGPYKIFDHYLAVQPWEPCFQPANAKLLKIAVWVHFIGVPMELYQEEVFMNLGDKVDHSIKVDTTTLLATKGEYARVCVEYDLNKPLPTGVEFTLDKRPKPTVVK